MTRASRLSHAARESALRALLREHPDAWVVAIASSGLFTTMPPEVPLAGQSVIQGQSSGLEMVVPADQNLVLTAWQRVLTDGFASTAVHLPSDPDRPVGINLVDVRDQYGVVLGVFVSFPPENAVGQPSPLVPRSCRIHKDQGGVVTAADAPASGILGWAEDELLGQRMLDLIHPDDQNRAIANWMDMVSRPGSTRRVRLRHRHRDGSWRWLEVTNHNRLDDPLQPHVVADMVDVHDEVIGAEALRANERLLRRLTDALPVGVVHITAERRVDYYNERLGALAGVDAAATVVEYLAHALPADRRAVLDALDDVMDRGLDLDVEVTFTAPRARSRRCVLSLRALTDEGGGVTGAIGCLIDITEDVTLREELEQRVRYDPLTGCLNRASVLAELEERLAAAGQDQAIVVAFVDLDDFKAINDQYGHPAGDSVLKHVATRLRQVGGDEGLVGRLGGDEFLVVLPARGPSDAPGSLADGIRAALHAPIRLGPQWIVPRASIGLAYALDPHADADGLVAVADAAMYESKRRGQGEPVIAEPGRP